MRDILPPGGHNFWVLPQNVFRQWTTDAFRAAF
jgi:hypothetical protein